MLHARDDICFARCMRRHAANETSISPESVSRLALKYVYETDGPVSATPTVLGDDAYVTDWVGGVHCWSFSTGKVHVLFLVVCCISTNACLAVVIFIDFHVSPGNMHF